MASRLRWLTTSAIVWLAFIAPARAGDFFFKDGDRVVIIGDSITEQHLYSNYVEAWTVTRFPAWKLTFRNVGIGGDRSTGGNRRFKDQVASFQPTALTVDFGMNDGNYRGFEPVGYKTYIDGLQGIADQAKAAHVRVAWITPSPVEKSEDGPAMQGYNETLEKYSAGVKEIAEHNGGLFVDQFHPFVELQEKARAEGPKNRIGGGDPVHPGPPGQAVMAWAILKGLRFPTMVSSVEVDADAGKIVKAENCAVTDLEPRSGGVRFQRQDSALPFFPEEARSILKWAPIQDELNDYRIKVSGLKSGRYEVRLGGKKVAEHSADELASGLNLAASALADGPVAEQVKTIWNAVRAKNQEYHDRIFRGVVLAEIKVPDFLGLNLSAADIEAKRQAAIKERLGKVAELDEALRRALVIKPHLVEIVPVKQ